MSRLVFACLFGACVSAPAYGSVKSVVVTKDNQAKVAPEITLATTKHPDPTLDTVYVTVTITKQNDFERLARVEVQAKDGEKLLMLIPVEVKTQADGTVVGQFHINPELAKKSQLRLHCPRKPLNVVTTYEVRLGTFME